MRLPYIFNLFYVDLEYNNSITISVVLYQLYHHAVNRFTLRYHCVHYSYVCVSEQILRSQDQR